MSRYYNAPISTHQSSSPNKVRLRPYKRKRRSSDSATPRRKWSRYFDYEEEEEDYYFYDPAEDQEEQEQEQEHGQENAEVCPTEQQDQDQEATPTTPPIINTVPSTSSPLENPLILSKILSFLPFSTLKAARGVNRLWNSISGPVFASKSVLELNSRLGTSPTDFWAQFGNSLPSSHLRLVRVDSRDPGLVKILQRFGTGVKSLQVDAAAGDEEEAGFPKNFFLQISTWCPNLESLTLRDLPDCILDTGFPPLMRSLMGGALASLRSLTLSSSAYYCGLDAHFLLDLLDWAPNLSSLSFLFEDDDALDEIFVALEIRGRTGQIRALESLSFGGNTDGSMLYEAQIQTLLSLELRRLKRLSIGRLGLDVASVTRLLKHVSSTLTHLKIGTVHMNGLDFPRMPFLKELELGNVANENHVPYFQSFPNLEKCTLGGITALRSHV